MKKIVLLISVVLFLACSDLSVSKQEALEKELPSDLNWKEYADINKDVSASQIAFDVQKKLIVYGEYESDSLRERVKDCIRILEEDIDFVGEIYMKYANCPREGWDISTGCTGIYASNPNYTIVKEGNSTCSIGACWSGGWDYPLDPIEYPGASDGFKSELPIKIDSYHQNPNTFASRFTTTEKQIYMLCRFILPGAENFEAAADYLKSFYSYDVNSDEMIFGENIDSTLIKQHYYLVGRSEGRPYKYCGDDNSYDSTVPRDTSLALKFRDAQGRFYFDYTESLFCLNRDDEKVYKVK